MLIELFKIVSFNLVLSKSSNNIFPLQSLQERVINVTYFLNKYDEAFIQKLFDEVDVSSFEHQVIEV